MNNFHNFRRLHFFHWRQLDDNEWKLFLNDMNYDVKLLIFLSTNKNESKMLGRDDLGRDSFQNKSSAEYLRKHNWLSERKQ